VVCVTGGDEEKRATVEAKNKKTGECRRECDEDVGLWVKVYMGAE
jgi:hypothetical protein